MPGRPQLYLDGGRTVAELRHALTAAGFQLGASRAVKRTMLDTFDGRLEDAGLRLEHREDDRPTLVLSDRRGSAPAMLRMARPPRFAADLADGPFRFRLAAATDGRALLPQRAVGATATPVTRRNRDAKTVAAATIYEDVATDGQRAAGWVVEVEEVMGYDGGTSRVHAELCDLQLVSADGDVFDLAGPLVAPGRAVGSPTIALDPMAPADVGFRAVLAHLASTIQLNVPGTIDDIDSEFLHELRVAVRRTRSVLSHAARVLPSDRVHVARREFAWLGEITGPARDLDVYQLEWEEYGRELSLETRAALEGIREHLEDQRLAAHARLATALGSRRTNELLAWWPAWLRSTTERAAAEGTADTADPGDTATYVGGRIRKAHRRLIAGGRAITAQSPSGEVHELRKDAKRLRYLLECFGGLYEAKPRRAFVARLKALQDNLGGHQDADVHGQRLREVTGELAGHLPVETVIAAGQLVEQLEQRRAATRALFAERFADFDSKPTRSALRAVLATVDR